MQAIYNAIQHNTHMLLLVEQSVGAPCGPQQEYVPEDNLLRLLRNTRGERQMYPNVVTEAVDIRHVGITNDVFQIHGAITPAREIVIGACSWLLQYVWDFTFQDKTSIITILREATRWPPVVLKAKKKEVEDAMYDVGRLTTDALFLEQTVDDARLVTQMAQSAQQLADINARNLYASTLHAIRNSEKPVVVFYGGSAHIEGIAKHLLSDDKSVFVRAHPFVSITNK